VTGTRMRRSIHTRKSPLTGYHSWTQTQLIKPGTSSDANFGSDSKVVNDTNGDGIKDIAISQPTYADASGNPVGGGRINIYSGADKTLLSLSTARQMSILRSGHRYRGDLITMASTTWLSGRLYAGLCFNLFHTGVFRCG